MYKTKMPSPVASRYKSRRGAAALLTSLVVLVCLARVSAFADFEDTGFGARVAGMGGGFSGLADDIYALVYNPAGLATTSSPQFTASYQRLFVGLDDLSELGSNFIAYSYPLPAGSSGTRAGTIAAGLLDFSAGGLYSENTVILSYSRAMDDALRLPLSLGVNAKYMTKKYASDQYTENAIDFLGNTFGRDPVFAGGYDKSVIGIDIGTHYRFSNRYSAGLVFTNVNTPDTGLGSVSRLPLRIAGGINYHDADLNVLLDGVFVDGNVIASPGVERWLNDREFALRGGLQLGSRELANLSCGASYNYKGMFRFDYAFGLPLRGVKDTSGTHSISLVMSFKSPDVTARAASASAPPQIMPKTMLSANTASDFERGVAFSRNGAYIKAYDSFTAVISENRHSNEVRRAKGYISDIMSAMQRAAADGRKADKALYARGLLLYDGQKYENALSQWDQLLQIEPQNTEVREYVDSLKFKLRKAEEIPAAPPASPPAAPSLAPTPVRLNTGKGNTDPSVTSEQRDEMFALGMIDYTEGRFTQAIAEWRKCLALDPDFKKAAQYIKKAELKQRKPR